jgi:SAM-dependent methyltransferase
MCDILLLLISLEFTCGGIVLMRFGYDASFYLEVAMKFQEIYTSGAYLERYPAWHSNESPWKAREIMKMIERSGIKPKSICEVGCGAGEILRLLQEEMDAECSFWGYEISPQAFELAKSKGNERLQFKLADFRLEDGFFDLLLLMDVIEHVEDCFSFLRDLKSRSQYKIMQIQLDLSVQTILRPNALLGFRSTSGHVGHVHYFTKGIALAMLEDLGYEVLDYFYTRRTHWAPTFLGRLLQLPRVLLYAMRKDLAVRIFGGYSLLVLAK